MKSGKVRQVRRQLRLSECDDWRIFFPTNFCSHPWGFRPTAVLSGGRNSPRPTCNFHNRESHALKWLTAHTPIRCSSSSQIFFAWSVLNNFCLEKMCSKMLWSDSCGYCFAAVFAHAFCNLAGQCRNLANVRIRPKRQRQKKQNTRKRRKRPKMPKSKKLSRKQKRKRQKRPREKTSQIIPRSFRVPSEMILNKESGGHSN